MRLKSNPNVFSRHALIHDYFRSSQTLCFRNRETLDLGSRKPQIFSRNSWKITSFIKLFVKITYFCDKRCTCFPVHGLSTGTWAWVWPLVFADDLKTPFQQIFFHFHCCFSGNFFFEFSLYVFVSKASKLDRLTKESSRYGQDTQTDFC